MIQLHHDCLVVDMGNGEMIPCSLETLTFQFVGCRKEDVDIETINHAAAGVIHYFKHELGRSRVTLVELQSALDYVFRSIGLFVALGPQDPGEAVETDLRTLACGCGQGFELFFFSSLRDELKLRVQQAPRLVRFKGLRGCVKQLVGVKRWTPRCQLLSDQIVEFLRTCMVAEKAPFPCALIVV